MPYPAAEAARLFQMGKAPEVWVNRPGNRAADLQKFGIHFVGEEGIQLRNSDPPGSPGVVGSSLSRSDCEYRARGE